MKNSKKVTKKAAAARMTAPVSEAESDRRLRPVLDALSCHNTKQALKQAQQAIQKRPGWPAARALRACALIQCEHYDDAEQEVADIRADLDASRVPLDEDCAMKLHMYYMEKRREDIAGEVYEQVWKADPGNFQLAEVAFCLYIRGGAFTAAQKLATKLHRLASVRTQKYSLWAVGALWLGLTCKNRTGTATNTVLDARMLKLASAMLSKGLDTFLTPSAEMARFAVRVFKDAGEYEKARDMISNPRLVIDEVERLHLRAELPASDGSSERDYRILLSQHDADNWSNWLKFFASIEGKEDWYTEALDFISDATSLQVASSNAKRGPSLAHLELLYRREELEHLSEAMVQYFVRFGAKKVCAHDLRPYLNAIKETKWFSVVFDDLAKIVEKERGMFHLTLSWMRSWYNLLEEEAEDLFAHYARYVSEKSEPTERQAGDDYLLLATRRLLPDVCNGGGARYEDIPAMLQAIAILETGLGRSPYNFDIKLLLVRLYIEIGATDRVIELWDSLEVKHVLLSTLTHVVLHPVFESGHHDAFQGILESIEWLWRECDQEVPECISKAFQVGSINAAVEFVLFRRRLEQSAILAECLVTEILHNIAATEGEGIGVKRAYACITQLPRFRIEGISKGDQLIANDDFDCFRFWEKTAHDSDDRVRCLVDDAKEDQGTVCTTARRDTIEADLTSLEALLRIAVKEVKSGNDGKTSDEKNAMLKCLLEKQTHLELPPASMLRVKIASNLMDVQQLLERSSSPNSTVLADCNQTKCEPALVLQSTEAIVQILLKQVDDIVGVSVGLGADHENNGSNGVKVEPGANEEAGANGEGSKNGEAGRPVFTPRLLRLCGRLVFDTLLVTCAAIVSYSPELVKGRRRAKKSASKTAPGKDAPATSEFETARRAILAYQQALISANSSIQAWIASCVERDLDWTSSILRTENQFSDLVCFLPDSLCLLDCADGTVRFGEEERSEFCDKILAQIQSSHTKTSKAIFEALGKLATRLKLADL